jgi:PRTRC genetic system protein C
MSRVFVYNGVEYDDPNPALSNEAVRDMLARTFGALVGGEIEEKEQGGRTVVEFRPRPQRKGAEPQHPVYTWGYGGRSVDNLRYHIERTGALVVDIRYNPNSRRPEWRGDALRQALPQGSYVQVRALGNENYKIGGYAKIHDMEMGVALLKMTLQNRPVLLLCGCADFTTCHRTMVADALFNRCLVNAVIHLD